jgi:hypothetical protein
VAIRITAVHTAGGTEHEHITEVEWVSIEHKNEGSSTREAIIDWLESDAGNAALIRKGLRSATVVVQRDGERTWLQAIADGRPSPLLLELPRY